MLNAIQIVIQIPLMLKLKIPGNVQFVSTFLVTIATFDLIPTDKLNDYLYYFPEEEPFSINFAQYGYDSRLFIGNMGLSLWIIYLNIFLSIICLLAFVCWKWLFKKLSPHLFWNGLIRLFIEVFQEVALIGALNLHTVEWSSSFMTVEYSNYLALIFTSLIFLVPIGLTVFYCRRLNDLNKKTFEKKYGAFLEGNNLNHGAKKY